MPQSSILLSPAAGFWSDAARALSQHVASRAYVVVPTQVHAQLLKAALAAEGGPMPLRISTLSGWLEQETEGEGQSPAPTSERLMGLYAELRQHGWLKKLFAARRNTDLLPLAQTLLALSDELTRSLLPQLQLAPGAVEERWQAALAQMTPSARQVLSDEAQLVWSVWQSQLDGRDAGALRFTNMMRLARHADAPLVWIDPAEPQAFEQAFIDAWSRSQPVCLIGLGWRAAALPAALTAAWPEMLAEDAPAGVELAPPPGVALCGAHGMEDEARQGAQTIIDWLAAGKRKIAIVAQDRAVARRIRALLERAEVHVADETGWKLSTTRAAAAAAVWLEVIAARAETIALLDLLKSPYLLPDVPEKSAQVMRIELALRRANVPGGWEAALAAVESLPDEHALLMRIAEQAARFAQRRPLPDWIALTLEAFEALGMTTALTNDPAGRQVLDLLIALEQDCRGLAQPFSLPEWRALLNLQLESTDFIPSLSDARVAMLPLNGARLRAFDAVLLVGADADHLPSQPSETLFFANAVRRELGLATRESLQRQQLRDFAALLSTNPVVVLSWQAHKDGEPNTVSPWIARLQLALERCGRRLPRHRAVLPVRELHAYPSRMPAPSAAQLLPRRLSASAYNKLVGCPYRFFAENMLGLTALDELSDLPQKRDYGDWLHDILKKYHDTLARRRVDAGARLALLREISESVFDPVLLRNPAALGYYVRWQKTMPSYVEWANERETQGWRFAFGEREFKKKLQWQGGEALLHGWVDRVDENETGELAVLDYKARNFLSLKRQIEERSDHQLAFYGLIVDRPVASAHYVALDMHNDKTRDVAANRYDEWQQQLGAQIVDNLRAISQGAQLPASGTEAVCQYCDVRGLCRKGEWQ